MSPPKESDTAEFAAPQNKARSRPELYSSLVRVDAAGRSHPGKVRPNNEDHFLITRFGRFLETVQTSLPDDTLPRSEEAGYAMVVADGMGGGAAGEEASRLAISGLVNLVLHTPDWFLRLEEEGPFADEVLRRATRRFEQVNGALKEEADDDPGLSGFGTTMTAAWSLGRDLFVAHLGDSRAYLLSGGRLRRLTRDHTLAQELLDQGAIGPEQAAAHRLRHVLTQALGDHSGKIRPDVMKIALGDDDCLLLCTDGLTEMVGDLVIGETLGGGESAQVTCQRLVDQALDAGGKDNVTAVVARYRLP